MENLSSNVLPFCDISYRHVHLYGSCVPSPFCGSDPLKTILNLHVDVVYLCDHCSEVSARRLCAISRVVNCETISNPKCPLISTVMQPWNFEA